MFWEYADWPAGWQKAALTRPWKVFELTTFGLKSLQLSDPDALSDLGQESDAPDVLFPKLGAKSWRDGRGVRPLANDQLLADRIAHLLDHPTPPQMRLITQMLEANAPLRLYLFPWRDMTQWSEARAFVAEGEVRITSVALRTAVPVGDWKATLEEKAADLAKDAQEQGALAIDLAFAPDRPTKLVEVNPGSTISL